MPNLIQSFVLTASTFLAAQSIHAAPELDSDFIIETCNKAADFIDTDRGNVERYKAYANCAPEIAGLPTDRVLVTNCETFADIAASNGKGKYEVFLACVTKDMGHIKTLPDEFESIPLQKDHPKLQRV